MKILNEFLAPKEIGSPWLQHIQQCESFMLATDGVILIQTPGVLNKKPEDQLTSANINYISGLLNLEATEEITLDCKRLREQLEEFKTQDIYNDSYEDCKTCAGEASVDWTFEGYTKEFDCPKCDGEGYFLISSEYLGKGFKELTLVKVFDNKHLSCTVLYKIASHFDTITLSNTEGNCVQFRANHYNGCIMKYMDTDSTTTVIDLT